MRTIIQVLCVLVLVKIFVLSFFGNFLLPFDLRSSLCWEWPVSYDSHPGSLSFFMLYNNFNSFTHLIVSDGFTAIPQVFLFENHISFPTQTVSAGFSPSFSKYPQFLFDELSSLSKAINQTDSQVQFFLPLFGLLLFLTFTAQNPPSHLERQCSDAPLLLPLAVPHPRPHLGKS